MPVVSHIQPNGQHLVCLLNSPKLKNYSVCYSEDLINTLREAKNSCLALGSLQHKAYIEILSNGTPVRFEVCFPLPRAACLARR